MNSESLEAQVTQYWGNVGTGNVIAQRHVAAGTSLSFGEEGADFLVPGINHDLVSWQNGQLIVTPPANATVFMDRLMATGASFALNEGHEADVVVGDFTFHITIAAREMRPVTTLAQAFSEGNYSTFAGSGIAHAVLLAAFAFFMPQMSDAANEDMDRQRILDLKAYMSSSAEHEKDHQETLDKLTGDDSSPSKSGSQAKNEEGAAGGQKPEAKTGHWTAKGDNRPEDVKLSREAALKEAQEFGMIGLLSTVSSDPKAPTVPWGNLFAGADKDSHMGNIWSGDPGDAFGNGLGLSGPGEGGGGKGDGIGVGDHGFGFTGTCVADCGPGGVGHGHGHLAPTYHPHEPGIRWAKEITTNGRLDPAVIQRIVRQNEGRIVACYKEGIRQNPSLSGRVAVQFMIGRDGTVTAASDTGGSDLPDANVRQCVVRSMYNIGFPEPMGGTVRVVYPFTFTPE